MVNWRVTQGKQYGGGTWQTEPHVLVRPAAARRRRRGHWQLVDKARTGPPAARLLRAEPPPGPAHARPQSAEMRGSRRPCASYSRCVESTSLATRRYLREGRPGTTPPDSGGDPGRGLIVSAALDAPLSARVPGAAASRGEAAGDAPGSEFFWKILAHKK